MAENTRIESKREKSVITQIKEYKLQSGNLETFYYPNNIMTDEMSNKTVIFMAMKGKSLSQEKESNFKNFKEGKESSSLDEVSGLAVLPLTSAISDDQSHQWSESSYLSAITGSSEGIGGWSEKTGSGGKIGSMVGKFFKGVSGVLNFANSSSSAISAVTDAFGVRKPLINPGQFQNYSGSQLRTFSFDFTFIPESESERDQVINIIKFFKRCSSPSAPKWTSETENDSWSSRMMMLSPMTWEVFVCNNTVNDLLSFHKCVCTRVSVKYGDSEKIAMFRDGMMKQITLGLSFSECELQTSRSYGDTEEWSNILAEATHLNGFIEGNPIETLGSTEDSEKTSLADNAKSHTVGG